jgi:hypothetical protein
VDRAVVAGPAERPHRFIYPASSGLSKPKIRCRLQALDPAKAYEAGLSLLKTVDLIAIREEKAGVVELSYGPVGAKKEIPVYTAVERLPAADEFRGLVPRPRFIDPRSAQAVLTPRAGRRGSRSEGPRAGPVVQVGRGLGPPLIP